MIRWLTARLGTASYYDYQQLDQLLDTTLIDVRDLTDREGNAVDLIKSKIELTDQALQGQNKVVVCCDKGISRSNAIALGALMASGMSYDAALTLLVEKVGVNDINLGLLHDIRTIFDAQKKAKTQSNILITGSSGLIGQALTKSLAEGYHLYCPERHELDLVFNLPLLDSYIHKHNIDFIIHLAHPRMRHGTSAMTEAVAMTKNILEVCRLNQVGLLYLSGLVVFSGYLEPNILQANSSLPPHPRGTYGETKFFCEELIRLYQTNYQVEATILRLSALYGPNMDKGLFLSKFYEAAKQGAVIHTHRYNNGTPVFDFLYLDDLVEAIKLTLQSSPPHILNIGTGQGFSTYEVAQIMVKITGSSSKVDLIDIDDQISKIIVDPSEAKTYLNWEAKIDLETGLKKLWT